MGRTVSQGWIEQMAFIVTETYDNSVRQFKDWPDLADYYAGSAVYQDRTARTTSWITQSFADGNTAHGNVVAVINTRNGDRFPTFDHMLLITIGTFVEVS